MFAVPRPSCWLAFVALTALARAQSLLPPERVSLDSLAAFRPAAANWQLAGGLAGDPRHDKTLAAAPGRGVLVNNPAKKPPEPAENLFTTWEHGDLEVDLDFLMATGSNSGVFLQGRYEVQLFDSWGVKAPTFTDCGGIYERWDAARGKGKEGYEGVAPLANACRAPGLWQHLHVVFEAPRFDAAGKKTKDARFVRVVLNGFTIHENVAVTGPTRSAAFDDEKPLGPLMIQGDHGSVAFKAFAVKRRDANAKVAVENLSYKLYDGDPKAVGDYDSKKATLEGSLEKFTHTAVQKSGKFALVFSGSLVVPRDGDYLFTADASGPVRLLVDERPAIVAFDKGGGDPVVLTLKEGKHAMRADFLQTGNGRPAFALTAESLACAPQLLTTDARPPRGGRTGQIAIESADGRVRLQRSFVPFEPKKRLYAINVGTPAEVNFSYDFETGALLRAWRGNFLDAYELWHERAENQLAKPTGPAITFNARPLVALVEFPTSGGWPDQPDAMASSQGYTLEQDGTPTFLSKLSDLTIRDRIAPSADGRGLARTLTFGGKFTDWSTWVLLAEADTITPQPSGGWVIGDREYYLDWPADPAHTPVVHTRGGKQQLVVRLSKATLEAPLNYSLVW